MQQKYLTTFNNKLSTMPGWCCNGQRYSTLCWGQRDGFVIVWVSLVDAFLVYNSLSFLLLTAPAEVWW